MPTSRGHIRSVSGSLAESCRHGNPGELEVTTFPVRIFLTIPNSSRSPATSFKMKGLLTELNICVDLQEVASVGGIERERLKQKPFRITRNGILNLRQRSREPI